MSKGAKYQPKPRRPLTKQECRWLDALKRCSFGPGTFAKRFVNQGNIEINGITEKQAEILPKLVHTYRRQIKAEIVAEAEKFTNCE